MLSYVLEQFGVAVSAISGVLAASNKRIDLFGVVVLALVTALGGGTLRDLILGAHGVFWMQEPGYIVAAMVTAVATFFVARRWLMPPKLFAIADAFALALFATIGAAKALSLGAGGFNAIVLGVITGVAGGVFRDVLVGEIPFVFRRETYLYATAAFVGVTSFVLLEAWLPKYPANRLIGTALTLALRLASIQWKLSLPVFRSRE